MNCPKCRGGMETVTFNEIKVDRCAMCGGIMFDISDKEALKEMKGSESIDFGLIDRDEEFNKIDKINCPKCDTQMIKMVDVDQPHIWYEYCMNCSSTFFDSGEFSDYKKKDLSDIINDIKTRIKGGRP